MCGMSHYFENDDSLPKTRKEVSFRFLGQLYTFETMAGVFSKDAFDYGSRVLLETVLSESIQGKVLDLGCGYGPIGILLKKHLPSVSLTMSDVNQRAIELAKGNAKRYDVEATILESDGFEKITGTFDGILLNPPIRSGKKVMYRLFEEAKQHLNPNGVFWIVIRKQHGANSAMEELKTLFDTVEDDKKEKGYWVIRSNETK